MDSPFLKSLKKELEAAESTVNRLKFSHDILSAYELTENLKYATNTLFEDELRKEISENKGFSKTLLVIPTNKVSLFNEITIELKPDPVKLAKDLGLPLLEEPIWIPMKIQGIPSEIKGFVFSQISCEGNIEMPYSVSKALADEIQNYIKENMLTMLTDNKYYSTAEYKFKCLVYPVLIN